MYTRAPSEVIHGRSFPAKSMICAVQLLMSKLDEVAPWHVIAATEICAARKGLLTGITNVVACSVPVEPKSPVQSCVPKGNNQPNDVIGHEMSIERDFRFAAACGQQQRCVGEHEGSGGSACDQWQRHRGGHRRDCRSRNRIDNGA